MIRYHDIHYLGDSYELSGTFKNKANSWNLLRSNKTISWLNRLAVRTMFPFLLLGLFVVKLSITHKEVFFQSWNVIPAESILDKDDFDT